MRLSRTDNYLAGKDSFKNVVTAMRGKGEVACLLLLKPTEAGTYVTAPPLSFSAPR
jgi:diphthamide synthase (EF-2-diphthine--ammonia ligase)